MAKDIETTVIWSPGIERNGEHWPVTVTFTAGGFVPNSPATYWQPAEGGMWEDTFFVSAEIEDGDPKTLTPAELALAQAWFDSRAATDLIQEAAADAWPDDDGPDPDRAYDEARDRAMFQRDDFNDDEPF